MGILKFLFYTFYKGINMSLFVGNISKNVKQYQLEDSFNKYGKFTIKQKGSYAFIEYESDRDGEEALEKLNGQDMGGLNIAIEWSKRSGRFDAKESHRPERKEKQSSESKCYNCNKIGHFARDCRSRRRSRSRSYDRRDDRRGGDRRDDYYRGRRSSRSRSYERRDRGDRRGDRDRRDHHRGDRDYDREERRDARRSRSNSAERKRGGDRYRGGDRQEKEERSPPRRSQERGQQREPREQRSNSRGRSQEREPREDRRERRRSGSAPYERKERNQSHEYA